MVKPHEIFNSKGRQIKEIKVKHIPEGKTEEIEIEWKIKPLTPRLLVNNFKKFAALETSEKKPEQMSSIEQAELMEQLAPLIDIMLPECCVDPKIVFEGDTTVNQINIDDIPMLTLMALFEEIFKSSGIDEAGRKKREDLKKAPSDKQLPNSA